MIGTVASKRLKRLLLFAGFVTALAITASASAYWSASGGGSGTANAGTLDAPTLSGTPGAGTVALSWSAVTPPGPGPAVTYYVKRGGSDAGGDCPTAAAPAAVLTCTDSGLSANTYSYTVTAVWRSWAATSSPVTQVTVAYGALDHFVLAAATTTPTAGQTDNLTITAKDAGGITVAAYGGSYSLNFSGAGTVGSFSPTVTNSAGTATTFGTATAITFTGGVATVSGSANGVMTLYKAETASIVVSDGSGHSNGSGLSVTVGPLALNSFAIPTPGTQAAGSAFSVSLTAKDVYGNTATGYTGTQCIAFSGPANSPGGTAPAYPARGACAVGQSSISFTNGAASPSVTLYNAASTTLTATDVASSKSGSTGAFTVNGAGINSFTIPTPATQTAGTAFSVSLTAKDAYGNTASYSGTQCIAFSGPANSPGGTTPTYPAQGGCASGQSSISFTNGAASPSVTLYNAASTTLTATDVASSKSGATSAFTVNPAAISAFAIPTPATQTAGSAFSVSLTANDAYGNTATGYGGVKNVVFSGPANSPGGTAPSYPASVTFTNGVGSASVTLFNATSTTLTATESGHTGSTGAFTVNGATISTFAIPNPGTQTAGSQFSVSLTANDAYGNTANYSGVKNVVFSGPANSPGGTPPSYPASVTFTNGVGPALVTLYNATSTTLTATESGHTGSTTAFTVNGAAISTFAIPTPATQTAGSAFSVSLTAKDAYGNTANYSGVKNVVFSGPANSPGGTAPSYPASVTFTNGVGSASVTLYNATSTTLTATESGHTGSTGAFTVNGAAISTFAIPTPATQTANTAFSISLTAKDAYGNTATYSGTQCIAFSGPGNSPDGHVPAYPAQGACAAGQSAVTFVSGVSNPNPSITLYRATPSTLYPGTQTTITATDAPSGKSGSTGAFNVNGTGVTTRFVILPATTTPVAGAADNLTIVIGDPYGNPVAYNGNYTLRFLGANSSPNGNAPTVTNNVGTAIAFGNAAGNNTVITFANGVATVTGANNGVMRLYRVETANVTVQRSAAPLYTSNAVAVTVKPAAITAFNVADPAAQTAGTAFNLSITATDTYGNTNVGTRCLTFSGPANSPNGTAPAYPAQGGCAAGQSEINFTAAPTLVPVTLYRAAATTIKVTDVVSGFNHTTASFTVNPATIDHFSTTATTTTPTVGQADNLTITANDPYGNTATGYTGAHNLTFSGARSLRTYNPTVSNNTGTAINFGSATAITFTNGVATVAGANNGVMRLYRVETALIVVSDGTYDNGSGLQITPVPAAMSGLSLAAEKIVISPGSTDNLTVSAIDQYGNAAPTYTGLHTMTFAGATGTATVTNSTGTARNFGQTTPLNFVAGVTTVSGSANGQLMIASAQRANITVTDGTYTSAALSVVVNGVSASMVSAGGFHTCAVVGGLVECWGYNNYGQLGDGTNVQKTSPVKLASPTNVTQVSAGKYQTCALRSDGTVYCWGQNSAGELGDGTLTDRSSPVQVQASAGVNLTNVAQISSGGRFTCARMNDGTVRCWGYGPFGQMGDGSTNTTNPYPLQVSGITTAIQVASGHNHVCALLADGTVRCWGYNAYGELGDSTTTNNALPVQVLAASGAGYLSGVTAIGSGRFHSCALISDGSVYCWGDNENGELGDGTTVSKSIPVRAGTIANATTISAGEYHSCSVLQDGTAQCWGAAAFGQVGDGTTADASSPVTVIGPGGYGVLSGIATVSAGGGNWPDGAGTDNYEHTVALLNDGTVVSWGQNIYGQLGDGTTTMSISPVGVALQ